MENADEIVVYLTITNFIIFKQWLKFPKLQFQKFENKIWIACENVWSISVSGIEEVLN